MVKIIYIEQTGAEHAVDVPVGFTVMEGAVKNGVPGILGDCGGSCCCGTCQVWVAEGWRARTGEASENEMALLDLEEAEIEGARLSCQIEVSEDLDGLQIYLPDKQF